MASRSRCSGSSAMPSSPPRSCPAEPTGPSVMAATLVEDRDLQADDHDPEQAVDDRDADRQPPARVGGPADDDAPDEELGDADDERPGNTAVGGAARKPLRPE